jgi:hypothetical protein
MDRARSKLIFTASNLERLLEMLLRPHMSIRLRCHKLRPVMSRRSCRKVCPRRMPSGLPWRPHAHPFRATIVVGAVNRALPPSSSDGVYTPFMGAQLALRAEGNICLVCPSYSAAGQPSADADTQLTVCSARETRLHT